jgi:hypothetical protein
MSLATFGCRSFAAQTFLPLSGVATSVPQAVHYRVLLAVQSVLQGLGLASIEAANIVVSKAPWVDRWVYAGSTQGLPLLFVSPLGSETMSADEGTNRRDDVGYPCLLVFCQSPDHSQTENLNRYLLWRERVHRAFRNQPLAGVDEILTCRAEPREIVVQEEFVRGVWQSTTALRFISRETRGPLDF